MSEHSIAAIDEKVSEHYAERYPGSLVTGWVLCTSLARDDDDGRFYTQTYTNSDHCDPARSMGLVEIARLMLRDDMGLTGPGEDDA